MSQNDFIIDNAPASTVRTDINLALQALASLNSGALEPSVTYPHMLWSDTANNLLKMRSAADDAWITLGALDQGANLFKASVELADQSEAETGANNTKSMTPLRTKQAIDEFASFTKFHTTGEVSATTLSALTTSAHGFGEKPKLVQVRIICKTADLGYSIGDEIIVNPATNAAANASYGQAIRFDATNLYIRAGAQWQIHRNDGTFGVALTGLTSWNYIVDAWA